MKKIMSVLEDFIMNINRMERVIRAIHGCTLQEEVRATHWLKNKTKQKENQTNGVCLD